MEKIHKPDMIYVLATCWAVPSDRLRLAEMSKITGAEVISVSENSETQVGHISTANFGVMRGIRDLMADIESKRKVNNISIILDYFWLEKNYYLERYGMMWLRTIAPALLGVGATEVLLPIDGGLRNRDGGNMKAMLSGEISPNITIKQINLSAVPLWMASNETNVNKFLNSIGRDNKNQTKDYLTTDTQQFNANAYLRITLKIPCFF